jgi:hypothetical protein
MGQKSRRSPIYFFFLTEGFFLGVAFGFGAAFFMLPM